MIDATKKYSESKSRLRLWLRLLRINREIEGTLRENMRAEFNSTLPRFDVLAALYQAEDGLRMSQLSAVLKVSNGNVTGVVDKLATEKLVERVPIENDRRAMLVKLSKKGKKAFELQAQTHEAWINELLDGFSAKEAEQLVSRFDQLPSKNRTKE